MSPGGNTGAAIRRIRIGDVARGMATRAAWLIHRHAAIAHREDFEHARGRLRRDRDVLRHGVDVVEHDLMEVEILVAESYCIISTALVLAPG